MLSTRPALTALSILTMGTGIGVGISQIIIYQGLMNPNLPFPEPEEIILVEIKAGSAPHGSKDIHKNLFYYWQEHQTSFESLISFTEGTINVYYQNRAVRYSGSLVNTGFTNTIQVTPFIGEGFKSKDYNLESPKKAILAYDAWENDFAADPSIIGKNIIVNSETTMVVGVMPKGFHFPYNSHIWIPDLRYPGQLTAFDPKPMVTVSGRLKKGVSAGQGAKELNRLKDELIKQLPDYYNIMIPEDSQIIIQPFVKASTDDDTRNILTLSTIVVILVLLIACANVTNLLLARFSIRQKEIAIRCALGATLGEIRFQLWIESFVIAFAGAGIGLIYSLWVADWGNVQFAKMEVPFWFHFSITKEVLFASLGVTLAAGFISGILPAMRVSQLHLNQIIQDDSRTASSLSIGTTTKTLVVTQISLSCALLIVTGMILNQISILKNNELGYDPGSVISARMGLFEGKYKSIQSKVSFEQELLQVLRGQDEIETAAITTRLQTLFPSYGTTYQVETEKEGVFSLNRYNAHRDAISDGFFKTLGVSLISGNDFNSAEPILGGFHPIMVTPEFVAKHYPGQDVLGKQVRLIINAAPRPRSRVFKIVAVAPNTFLNTSYQDEIHSVGLHTFYENTPTKFLTVTIRPAKGYQTYSLIPLLKRCVAQVDNEIPLYFIETPKDSYDSQFAGIRFGADLFRLFSTVALFLSFVGTFGITSFSILERIQEIGIRKSVGATGEDIFMLILRQGALHLAIGLTLGVVGGISLSYALKSVFHDMHLVNPFVYAFVILILTVSSLLATFFPARKAAMILPAEATRVN